jgi:DNA-binding NtrC family response regulator
MKTQPRVPHLLLIDDSPEIHELIADLLAEEPIRLTARLEAGLDMEGVIQLAPDLIIFDSRTGAESSGLLLMSKAACTLHIPLILCTGAIQEEVDRIVEAMSPIPLTVIRKPFDIDTLLGAIRNGVNCRRRKSSVLLA